MSASITATITSGINVVETFNGIGVNPNNNSIAASQLSETVVLNGSSSPAATLQAQFSQALSTGTATLDLTSLPGLTSQETVNGTGLKVQQIKLMNPSTNANKITAAQGASNAYRLDGATNWSIPLAPGQSVLLYLDGAADVVGSSHKTIDLAGTGAQALNVAVVFG